MLIDIQDSLRDVLQNVRKEIRRAAVDRKHPFRFVVLGTVQSSVAMRYVVLRKVDEDFNLLIYTDHRSRKVKDVVQNPNVQLLFYHPQKRVQVIISCRVAIHHNDELAKKHWNHVQGEARKAYCSIDAPGERIDAPSDAYEWEAELSDKYFTVLSMKPNKIEVLQLNGLEHLRAIFENKSDWNGQWLVP
ncbi:MAG: pyridoxamine 5'-phosphate oxidase family protein [Bacteroidota bacterium]